MLATKIRVISKIKYRKNTSRTLSTQNFLVSFISPRYARMNASYSRKLVLPTSNSSHRSSTFCVHQRGKAILLLHSVIQNICMQHVQKCMRAYYTCYSPKMSHRNRMETAPFARIVDAKKCSGLRTECRVKKWVFSLDSTVTSNLADLASCGSRFQAASDELVK